MSWVAVAVAGALGAVARYLLDQAVTRAANSDLPWGTTVINVSGSFLAGIVAGLLGRSMVSPTLAIVVAGGFLGAYTTFSTAMYEAARLVEERLHLATVATLLLPLLGSVVAAALGWWVAAA